MEEAKKRPVLEYLRSAKFAGDDKISFIAQLVEEVRFNSWEGKAEEIVAAIRGIPHGRPMSEDIAVKQFGLNGPGALNKLADSFYTELGRAMVHSITPKPREWWQDPVIKLHEAPRDDKGQEQVGITLVYPNGTMAELEPMPALTPLNLIQATAAKELRRTWDESRNCICAPKEIEEPDPPPPPPDPDPDLSEKYPLNTFLFLTVKGMETSVRVANCLGEYTNITLVGELVQRTDQDMLKIKNFGRKSLKEVKEILASMGLSLNMKIDDWQGMLGEIREILASHGLSLDSRNIDWAPIVKAWQELQAKKAQAAAEEADDEEEDEEYEEEEEEEEEEET